MAAECVDSPMATSPGYSVVQSRNEQTLDNTGYCLLSLDGGGVRGLSTLYILRNIMNTLNHNRKEAGLEERKPCEIFDLMGGTSTGGLIAIMLGRLEMTVDECIEAYVKLMRYVFEKKQNRSIIGVLGGVKPRFSSKALRDAISKVIKDRDIPLEEKFDNGKTPRCRVFVCTNLQKTNTVTRLRNYRIPAGCEFQPTILDAALATSAAPTYFSDIDIAGSKFVDGAFGANNPTFEVEEEASDLWCEDTGDLKPLVKCFISIGTGNLGVCSISDKGLKHLVATLQKEATQTEATNQQFLGRWREGTEKGRVFRFNVEQGLQGVKLQEFEEQDLIQSATSAYLKERDTRGKVGRCVENLRMKQYQPSSDFAHKIKQEMSTRAAPRPSQALARATSSEIAELIKTGNSHLKISSDRQTTKNLLQARHFFSKALQYLKNDPTTSPKQVSRVCQKLMESSLGLSKKARDMSERKKLADEAREYGEAALENVVMSGDKCMVAQVEFLLACVTAWKVYLQARGSGVEPGDWQGREGVEVLMQRRLNGLRVFGNLDMERYEEQAEMYLALFRQSVEQMWEMG